MEVRKNSLEAWVLAMRPKTLTGAAIPVLVASALAWIDGRFCWLPAWLCLVFACLMQVAANFINDLFDYLKGSDRPDRLGPERACAQGWISPRAMRWGIAVVVVLACLDGLGLLAFGNPTLLVGIGLGCVVFAFLYTTVLSYCGMGDVLVLVFFGLVPVVGTYYVVTGQTTSEAWLAGVVCGLLIDTLLVLNNYRDRDTDRRDGKHTLVTIFGERFGRFFYLFLGITAWLLCYGFWMEGHRMAFLLPLLYVPVHIATWCEMVNISHGKALNRILGKTSRNMLLFGLLLVAGLLLS